MEIGLSLGSNTGDRSANLSRAGRRIADITGVVILARSPVYETEPVGVPPEFQALKFLNAVLIIESGSDPRKLLATFQGIEEEMGRSRAGKRNVPRPIDIDIIYAGQTTLADDRLVVPHPRWQKRAFVVKPLSDVRPAFIIPGTLQTVKEILFALPDRGKVVRFTGSW